MDFLKDFPDIQKFFENYILLGKIYDQNLEKKIQDIYQKNHQYNFFRTHLISIDAIVKELLQNAFKANVKRWIIERYNLDPTKELDYKKLLRIFKHLLYFVKIEEFENKSMEFDYWFCLIFSFHPKVCMIHVLNEGSLLQREEERIRKKFMESRNIVSVYDYYSNYSDAEEGAGMGIAMIVTLLKQMGLEHRNFLIFNHQNQHGKDMIVSRVYIPMDSKYLLPRKKFEILQKSSKESVESIRQKIQSKHLYIPFL